MPVETILFGADGDGSIVVTDRQVQIFQEIASLADIKEIAESVTRRARLVTVPYDRKAILRRLWLGVAVAVAGVAMIGIGAAMGGRVFTGVGAAALLVSFVGFIWYHVDRNGNIVLNPEATKEVYEPIYVVSLTLPFGKTIHARFNRRERALDFQRTIQWAKQSPPVAVEVRHVIMPTLRRACRHCGTSYAQSETRCPNCAAPAPQA